MGARIFRHAAVSRRLEAMSDAEVLGLPVEVAARSVWTTTGTVEVEGHPVFVKRVPVTAVEAERPYSTANHFRLPGYYHYGVGSAGFGAYRELAGLSAASDLVLAGAAGAFPVLYHHRLLPGAPGPWTGPFTPEQYGRYWGGSPGVAAYVKAREDATRELWLFMEHFPHTASDRLLADDDGVDRMVDQLCEAAAQLRAEGIVHFDAHLANVMTDGPDFYLADFGLVGAHRFEVDAEEREFLGRHRYYDAGLLLAGLGMTVAFAAGAAGAPVRAEVDRICGLDGSSSRLDVIMGIVDNAASLAGVLGLGPPLVAALGRYREVNRYVHRFIGEMQARPAKDAVYRDEELLARLRQAGTPHLD
ncbi:MAG TPA: hypothetical protein VFH45_04770 [Acidimicrobiales bacterium]|nr:hypothetical protein [Acidimicrobiales bacterium]